MDRLQYDQETVVLALLAGQDVLVSALLLTVGAVIQADTCVDALGVGDE